MPRVSVITGYYNRAHALERTIMSVLNQTFRDFEFIVFDDASTDDTAVRLRELEHRVSDPRLKVRIHKTNTGFTRGLINAIKDASGEYIAIVGSGDYCESERLARQVELLDARPDVGAVGCWYTNVVEGTGVSRPRRPVADDLDLDGLLRGNVFTHGEVTFRKEIYETVGGYRSRFLFCQDYDLWLRMIKVSRLATVCEFLYERPIQFDGVSYEPSKFIKQSRYSVLAKRLAAASEDEATAMYSKISPESLEQLVPLSDGEIQQKVRKAILRAVIWQNMELARRLADESLVSRLEKPFYKFLVTIMERTPLLLSLVTRMVGARASS